ncbi:transcription elongation factor GreA, partial [Limosilactobacillus fermentum]|nr:transcription elongation factor GreA [Limosilactobacillus fermentum]
AARALGDLSENTEYSTAKRELRHLESCLRYLDKQLTYAKVIDVSDDGKVALGKVVTIRFLDDQEEATYKIVGRHQAEQASLTEEFLAFDSPLGLALKGHTAGTTVTVHAP